MAYNKEEIDHKELIIKYISHVHYLNGYTYLDLDINASDIEFTEAQKEELIDLLHGLR